MYASSWCVLRKNQQACFLSEGCSTPKCKHFRLGRESANWVVYLCEGTPGMRRARIETLPHEDRLDLLNATFGITSICSRDRVQKSSANWSQKYTLDRSKLRLTEMKHDHVNIRWDNAKVESTCDGEITWTSRCGSFGSYYRNRRQTKIHNTTSTRIRPSLENTTNVWNTISMNVMMNLYNICNDCDSPFGNEWNATKRQQSGVQQRESIIRRISEMIELLWNLMIYPNESKISKLNSALQYFLVETNVVMRPVPLVAVPVVCEQPREDIQKPSVC